MIDTMRLAKALKETLESKKFDDIDSVASVAAVEYARQELQNPTSNPLELVAACKVLDQHLRSSQGLRAGYSADTNTFTAEVGALDRIHEVDDTFSGVLVELAKAVASK